MLTLNNREIIELNNYVVNVLELIEQSRSTMPDENYWHFRTLYEGVTFMIEWYNQNIFGKVEKFPELNLPGVQPKETRKRIFFDSKDGLFAMDTSRIDKWMTVDHVHQFCTTTLDFFEKARQRTLEKLTNLGEKKQFAELLKDEEWCKHSDELSKIRRMIELVKLFENKYKQGSVQIRRHNG